MRTQDYENKQRAGAVATEVAGLECQPGHTLYRGSRCPACQLRIPPGPYTPDQMRELFGSALFIGTRRASDPDPAEVANPVTAKETTLRAELAAMSARSNQAKIALAHAEGSLMHRPGMRHAPAGVDPDAQAQALAEVAYTEMEFDRLNRAMRSEAAQRQGRIKAWRIKHGG